MGEYWSAGDDSLLFPKWPELAHFMINLIILIRVLNQMWEFIYTEETRGKKSAEIQG